jgi:DNA-binding transcriptional MerR regulator
MTKYWKVGELAELTGLSIRTLRYYDQINLFSPSEYTASGHRRYTHGDLQKLHEILVLKQMGLSLEEIQEMINSDENNSAMETIDKQIDRVQEDIQIQQQLLNQLEKTKKELADKKYVSMKELTSIFELMKMNRSKYFSNAQLTEMRSYYEQVDQDALKAAEEEFQLVLTNLRLEKEKGTSPKAKTVKELAMRWENMAYSSSKGDPEIEKNAEAIYAANPNAALRFGLDAELYHYIREALQEE